MQQHWALPILRPSQSQATVQKMLFSLCYFAQKCSILLISHTMNSVIWTVFKGLYKTSSTHSSSFTSHTCLNHPTSFNQAALFTDSSAFLSPCLAPARSLAWTARSPSLTHSLPIFKGMFYPILISLFWIQSICCLYYSLSQELCVAYDSLCIIVWWCYCYFWRSNWLYSVIGESGSIPPSKERGTRVFNDCIVAELSRCCRVGSQTTLFTFEHGGWQRGG